MKFDVKELLVAGGKIKLSDQSWIYNKADDGNALWVHNANGDDFRIPSNANPIDGIVLGSANTLLMKDSDGLIATASLKLEGTDLKMYGFSDQNEAVSTVDLTPIILKDTFIESAQLQGDELVLTFNTEAGKEALKVDLTKYLDPVEVGDGLEKQTNTIKIKLDDSGEDYLSISEAGLKIDGIESKIDEKIQEAKTDLSNTTYVKEATTETVTIPTTEHQLGDSLSVTTWEASGDNWVQVWTDVEIKQNGDVVVTRNAAGNNMKIRLSKA